MKTLQRIPVGSIALQNDRAAVQLNMPKDEEDASSNPSRDNEPFLFLSLQTVSCSNKLYTA